MRLLRCFCQILTKVGLFGLILIGTSSIKFHENPSGGSCFDRDKTDEADFRSCFVNAFRNSWQAFLLFINQELGYIVGVEIKFVTETLVYSNAHLFSSFMNFLPIEKSLNNIKKQHRGTISFRDLCHRLVLEIKTRAILYRSCTRNVLMARRTKSVK